MNLRCRLFLASNSPRRQQLLQEAGLPFEVVTREIEETYPPQLDARLVARYLAEKKADAYTDLATASSVVLTADTVVICDDEVLGKPKDEEEALSLLKKLSGRTHEVVSGCCMLQGNLRHSFDDTARVYFRSLSEEELLHYIRTYRPYDKAGAYGIQEWIGLIGIEKLEGSFYTVMGLPIHKVYEKLRELSCIQYS